MSRTKLRTLSRQRLQTASNLDNRFLLTSSAGLARTRLRSAASNSNPEIADHLMGFIEHQRGALGQHSRDIQRLQSDIKTMGKMLVEERSKSAQYSQMCALAEKELEVVRQQAQEAAVPLPALPPVSQTPPVIKKLTQENFLLKTDLDNLQHQLALMSRESEDLHRLLDQAKRAPPEHLSISLPPLTDLTKRVEDYEQMVSELQRQVVWVNGENSRLGVALVERENRIRELEGKLNNVAGETTGKNETIERLNVDAANRRLEIDKRQKEIKELKEQVGYLQQIVDKSPYQLRINSSSEEELKRKIAHFKSEAIIIAEKYQTMMKDRNSLEERVRFYQLAHENVLSEMEALKKQHLEEKAKLKGKIENLRQDIKGQYISVKELETELQKKGKGFEQLGLALKLKQELVLRFTDENTKLKAEEEKLREELKNCEPAITAAKAEVSRLEEQLTQSEILTADYEQLRYQNEKLKHNAAALDKEIATLKKTVDSYKEKIDTLEGELSRERNISKNWKAGLLDMKKEVMDAKALKATCHQLQDALAQAEEDKRSLKAQCSKKEQELYEVQASMTELRHSIDHQHNVNAQLKEQVESLNTRLQTKLPKRQEIEAKLTLLHTKEEEVKAAIARTVNATKAIESDLCCIVCLQVVEDAVLCIPCGHFYCSKCREGYHPYCQQCGQGKKVKATMKISVLDEIAGKVHYRKKVMSRVQ